MLGEKLKQARLEKGLSQRQLCGEEITRNMLSQIENGSARPSMATLTYLARQLDKPVSYFLEEDTTSPNLRLLRDARDAYLAKDYALANQLLESYPAQDPLCDPEAFLLRAMTLMALSTQAAAEGKHIYARTLLEKAREAGAQTPYYTPALERERILLLHQVQPEDATELARLLPPDPRENLLLAQAVLEQGQPEQAGAYLNACRQTPPVWYLLQGKAALAQENYPDAIGYYQQAEAHYPEEAVKALELCYRELGDYKNAYLYACKQKKQ